MAEFVALEVSGIGLIYGALFFRPGPSSLVVYPFQLYFYLVAPFKLPPLKVIKILRVNLLYKMSSNLTDTNINT